MAGAFGWVRQANVRSLGFALGWCTPCHFLSQLNVFLAFPGTNINSQVLFRAQEGTAHGSGQGQPTFGARELLEGKVARVYFAPCPATAWAGHRDHGFLVKISLWVQHWANNWAKWSELLCPSPGVFMPISEMS